MKKKLEAELISIAHRILQLKHKDDVRELHHETQKLYEKLSVLLFVEENFSEIKPTIGIHEIEKKLEKAFDFDEKIIVAEIKEEDNEAILEIKTVATPNKEESISEIIAEEPITDIPIIETHIEEKLIGEVIPEEIIPEEVLAEKLITENPIIEIPKPEKKQISFDDILGSLQPEPIFDRISEAEKTKDSKVSPEIDNIKEDKPISEANLDTFIIDIEDKQDLFFEKADPKPATNLNDKLNKGINIGINDKIAFEKNLFGGSSEDFNRVISQISTFDTLEEAKNFIDEMVKPDYNNWKGQDEFVTRFMEFVENKFA